MGSIATPRPASDVPTVPLVVALRELGARDIATAGGKGANLGELVRAGFAVPDGFVLTTRAYRMAIARTGVDPEDPARARAHLASEPVPEEIATAVRDAYDRLGGGRVAVRSSATAEDLPDASFAGQQDTLLDVEREDGLLDAVRQCWASLWNARAIAYRATQGIDDRSLDLAVVVQRMVDARLAGVLFTADPVTGQRRHAVIEAVAGLGDRLVSGAVNPDRFVLDTRSGEVLERHGNLLSDDTLRSLASLGDLVEQHFETPQDIEWAIDRKGGTFLVQTRAITTLYPLPAGQPDPDLDPRIYFSANVAQGVLEPLTPMGLQTFRLIGSAFATAAGRPPVDVDEGIPILRVAGLRLWIDATDLLRNPLGQRFVLAALSVMEARSATVFQRLAEDSRFRRRRGVGIHARSALAVLRTAVRFGVPRLVIRALLRPDRARERTLREIDTLIATDPGPLDTSMDRIDAFERLVLTVTPRLFPRLVAVAIAGVGSYGIARRVLGSVATEDELRTTLRGLPHNPTTEMDLELWAIARRCREDRASRRALMDTTSDDLVAAWRARRLPPLLQSELGAFLEAYGHRAVAEIDVGLARWSEDPAHLFGAIQNYLRLDDSQATPDTQFARGAVDAETTIATLLGRLHGPRRLLARALFRRVRALLGLREAPKFHVVRLFARYREILAPVGADLVSRGAIGDPADIWFLSAPEARRGIAGEDLRELVKRRRTEYARERRRRHVPRVLLSDGTDAEAAIAVIGDDTIRGTAASPGIATGTARVVRSPTGARLEAGDVLVAPSTDPGWTPLFLTASALVMEMGGMMSHGAVVAREYGIPAVVGVPNATERIATGDNLVVDGSAGTVERQPAAEPQLGKRAPSTPSN
jgi:phosphohistidine swiveling domain-containing protein